MTARPVKVIEERCVCRAVARLAENCLVSLGCLFPLFALLIVESFELQGGVQADPYMGEMSIEMKRT